MMMIVDTEKAESFEKLVRELDGLGGTIGVVIKCQQEEIFDKMHRI